jgi:hypothetical protein
LNKDFSGVPSDQSFLIRGRASPYSPACWWF